MKRPIFLTIWLGLMTIGYVYSLYTYTLGAAALQQVIVLPSWAMPVYAILAVAGLGAVAMLWMWKMAGFQLAVGLAVVSVLLSIMTLGITAGMFSIISALVGVGILYLAMKPVWGNFK